MTSNDFNYEKFNGQNINYYITHIDTKSNDNDINNLTDEQISDKILNNENIKNNLPKNCILFTDLQEYCQMYLIDDNGNNKQIKFPISFDAVINKISYEVGVLNNTISNKVNELNETIDTSIKETYDTLVEEFDKLYLKKVDAKQSYLAYTNTNNLIKVSYTGNNKQANLTTDVYVKNYAYSKAETDRIYQPKGEYLTRHQDLSAYAKSVDIAATYQPKGEYLTEHQDLSAYAKSVDIAATYQPKGEYLTEHQDLSEYAKTSDIAATYQQKGEYALISHNHDDKYLQATSLKTINNESIIGTGNISIDKGDPGEAATITIGEVSTGEVGSQALVTNVGTTTNAILNFVIPKGERGPQGPIGSSGDGTTIYVNADWAANDGEPGYISNKPQFHQVAFSGNYNQLNNIPNLAGYATIEQLPDLTNYYTKNETNNLLNNKQDLLISPTENTNGTELCKINGTSIYWKANNALTTGGTTSSNNIYDMWALVDETSRELDEGSQVYNPDSLMRLLHVERNKYSMYDSITPNDVRGQYSISIGFGASIGIGDHDFSNGIFSTAEGYLATIHGRFAHAGGYNTSILGDYSFSGGLHDGFDYLLEENTIKYQTTQGNLQEYGYSINGNYSFGYGKNIVTLNNGEVAFGKYNYSRSIELLQIPIIGEKAYDNEQKEWTIVDYHRLDIDTNWHSYYGSGGDDIDELLHDIISKKILNRYIDAIDIEDINNENIAKIKEDASDEQKHYVNFINKIFDIDATHDEFLWITDDNNYRIKINAQSFYNHGHHPCKIREHSQYDELDYVNSMSYHIDHFNNNVIFRLHEHKSNYIYNYGYTPNSETSNCGLPSGNYSHANEKMIIGVIAKNSDNIYDFFIWGPNMLYYHEKDEYNKDKLFTMLSIGNGNQYKRNNLFEVTNDGNVYYDNGKKNLFELENKIKNISNNLNQNVTNINNTFLNSSKYNQDKLECDDIYSSEYDDYFNKYLIIPINNETPTPFIINNSEIIKDNIILFINENELNYLKRTIIIDSTCYTNNQDIKIYFLSTKNGENLKYNICINHIDDQENTFYITADNGDNNYYMNLFKTIDIDYMYKIDIEIMNNICFIDTKGYFQNGNFND